MVALDGSAHREDLIPNAYDGLARVHTVEGRACELGVSV